MNPTNRRRTRERLCLQLTPVCDVVCFRLLAVAFGLCKWIAMHSPCECINRLRYIRQHASHGNICYATKNINKRQRKQNANTFNSIKVAIYICLFRMRHSRQPIFSFALIVRHQYLSE